MTSLRFPAIAISVGCLGVALYLAYLYPLAPVLAAVAVLALTLVCWRWPNVWLWLVPALLPAADFSPWTGWVAVQEFDLLLLATAAGGYAALAAAPKQGARLAQLDKPFRRLLVALVAFSLVGLYRGIVDAGGLEWNPFGGYQGSMNSLRIFKGLFFAVLLLPLLRRAFRDLGERAGERLAVGIVCGLTILVLAVLWERFAYPGLLDFSTIYRATGLFWEMHIGGAAIDGYLALAVPIVVWALLRSGPRRRWYFAALLAVLVGYTVLMTFSRGIYVALAVALVVLIWLCRRQRRYDTDEPAFRLSWPAYMILGAALVAVIQAAFMAGGYPGAFALIALGVMAMAVNGLRTIPWWPCALTTQGGILVAVLLIIEVVAVANGGSFLRDRMNSSERDFGGRLAHWRQGVNLLDGPEEWLFGIGMGRMPGRYAGHGSGDGMPADFRLANVDGRNGAVLFGPEKNEELGGLFGIAQQVPILSKQSYFAGLDVWAMAASTVRVSVCEKHLIYERACVVGDVRLGPAAGWRHLAVPLVGDRLDEGPWYARRHGVFAVSVLDAGRAVAIADVSLIAAGSQWLDNGDFSAGLAHWFLDGSYYFVPWHIDNLALECLLDGGLAYLGALLALVLATMRRLSDKIAGRSTLAPFFAAALIAYLIVGLFSSLMDAPRVAFLFFTMLFSAWLLPEISNQSHECA